MKFTIQYSRKLRVCAYDMLEIGLVQEFDSAEINMQQAFDRIKGWVDEWIEKERDRLLEKSVPRPEAKK
jgi:hypothetical protein